MPGSKIITGAQSFRKRDRSPKGETEVICAASRRWTIVVHRSGR